MEHKKLADKAFLNIFFSISLLFLLGIFASFAFAPLGYWLVLVPSFWLFFLLIENNSLKISGFYGFIFGLGFYGAGTRWLWAVLEHIEQTFLLYHQLTIIGIVVCLALFFTPLAWIFRFCRSRFPIYLTLCVVSILWGILEWIKTWLFTGLPFLQLSYPLVDTPFSSIARVTNEFYLSAWIICVSLLVYFISLNRRKKPLYLLLVLLLTTPLVINFGFSQPSKLPLNIAIIHGIETVKDKNNSSKSHARVARYLALTHTVANNSLVIWPESSITLGFSRFMRQYGREFEQLKKRNITVLLGANVKQRGNNYNAIVQANKPSNYYFKQHLVPFGEYTPDIYLFKALKKMGFGIPNAGTAKKDEDASFLFDIEDIKFAPSICFEALFSNEISKRSTNSDAIINSNDLSWFSKTNLPEQFIQALQMRAIENHQWVFVASNGGVSAIINPSGEVVSSTEGDEKIISLYASK